MENGTEVSTDNNYLLQLRDESTALAYSPEELNTRLIDYTNRELLYDPTVERPTLEIIEDATIAIGGVSLKLSASRVFALNALRLSQGYGQTAQELGELGFSGSRNHMSASVATLARMCNELSVEPMIELYRTATTSGSPFVYTLLPEVEIVDRRPETDEQHKKAIIESSVERNVDGQPIITGNGAIAFVSPQKRKQITTMMVQDYRAEADPEALFGQLFGIRQIDRSTRRPVQHLAFLPALSRQEEAELLRRKEEALFAYVQGGVSEVEAPRIIDGVQAIFELYAHNLDIVGSLAKLLCTTKTNYAELYQEGAAQLMEAVLQQAYFKDHSQNFRFIASRHIRSYRRRGLHHLRFESVMPPVHIPFEYIGDRDKVMEIASALKGDYGREPTIMEISQHSTMAYDKIRGILNLTRGYVYLDSPQFDIEDPSVALQEWAQVEDFADPLLDQTEHQSVVDFLFRSEALDDTEKAALSLQFGIFHPSLRGTILSITENAAQRYPDTAQDFASSIQAGDFRHLSGASADAKVLRTALRKSRNILATVESGAYSILDRYPRVESQNTFDTDAEKHELVALAREISPDKKIGSHELRQLAKQGDFPASEAKIVRLFGSLQEFHRACGFQQDAARKTRGMSADDIIDLAIAIHPKEPLKTNEIKVLSGLGEFVSTQAITTKFGSIRKFREICAAAIEARKQQT